MRRRRLSATRAAIVLSAGATQAVYFSRVAAFVWPTLRSQLGFRAVIDAGIQRQGERHRRQYSVHSRTLFTSCRRRLQETTSNDGASDVTPATRSDTATETAAFVSLPSVGGAGVNGHVNQATPLPSLEASERGDEENDASIPAGVGVPLDEASIDVRVEDEQGSERRGGELEKERDGPDAPDGSDDAQEVVNDAPAKGVEEEEGRRRDLYKIRSLLLQGQIAGLRQRLKERELDVKELRILTGGRGQSKLRELGALLKEARGECEALRAREKALMEELSATQREGDELRGDLLANQKALVDLNVYADSLRSRYSAEMVKLEASLAEMERELTRAEAAHMRERRELLDREASAVAEGMRYRNRTVLLQGEVVKQRARETELRQENARLMEQSSGGSITLVDENVQQEASSSSTPSVESQTRGEGLQGQSEVLGVREVKENEELAGVNEVANLREENNALKSLLESLKMQGEASDSIDIDEETDGSLAATISGDAAEGEAEPQTPVRLRTPIPVGAILRVDGPTMEPVVPEGPLDANEGIHDDTLARTSEDAGLVRVLAALRGENYRLRVKLRVAEEAAEAAEDRATEEIVRSDRLESEIERMRVTVKGRVRALKAALEEAEQDATRWRSEKEEHMRLWEEDVDALRSQLRKERKGRRGDREELESVITALQARLRKLEKRPPHTSMDRNKSETSAIKRIKRPSGKSDHTRARQSGTKPLDQDRPSREYGRGGRSNLLNRSEEISLDDDGVLTPEKQWDKAMRLMQYLDG